MNTSSDAMIAMYFVGVVLAIALTVLFIRWAFAITKQLENQEKQINLLKLIAKKQGVAADEIENVSPAKKY